MQIIGESAAQIKHIIFDSVPIYNIYIFSCCQYTTALYNIHIYTRLEIPLTFFNINNFEAMRVDILQNIFPKQPHFLLHISKYIPFHVRSAGIILK